MYRNLNAEMSRCDLTREQMAELMGMHKSTFSNKLNGRANFTLPEIKKIKRILRDMSTTDKELSLDMLFEEDFEKSGNPETPTIKERK